MRAPKRTPIEKLEDAFTDLSLDEQSRELKELEKLHRWCKRERTRESARPSLNLEPSK